MADEERSLKEAVLTGVRWVAAARGVAEAMGLVTSVVLARLIAPEDYGRAVVALALYWIVTSLFVEGFTAPLVQPDRVDERSMRTAVLLSGLTGLGCALLFAVVVTVPAAALVDDRTADLLRIVGITFAFNGLATVPQAVLQRRLDFKRLGAIEAIGLVVGNATAIVLAAVVGLDAEAIVIGIVVQGAVALILFLASVRLPRPAWNRDAARALLAFGGPAALSSVIFTAFRNVDYAIVAARLGASASGLFYRAHLLAIDYTGKVSGIMLRLAFPVYSRTEDRDQMRRIRGRIVRAHATGLFPALVLLVPLAPTLIPALYGPQWEDAIVPAQILAVGGLVGIVTTGFGPLLLAAGRPGLLLAVNATNAAIYAVLVFLVAPSGLVAVAIATAAFWLAQGVAVQFVMQSAVGVPVRDVVDEVLPAAASSAALLAVTWPLAALLREASVPAVVLLPLAAAAGGVVYLLVLRMAFRDAFNDLRLMADAVTRRRGTTAG